MDMVLAQSELSELPRFSATLLHGYANPLKRLNTSESVNLHKCLILLDSCRIHATRWRNRRILCSCAGLRLLPKSHNSHSVIGFSIIYLPAVLFTHFATKLVFSVSVRLFLSATVSQPIFACCSHVLRKLSLASPCNFFLFA